MESNVIESVTVAGELVAADFSVWSLFLRADIVVKLVMLVLFAMSFWSWTIIIDKWLRMRRLAAMARRFEEDFWSGGSLDELYQRVGDQPDEPMASVFAAAMQEWRRSSQRGLAATEQSKANLRERIERVMDATLLREMERIERYMTFLASAGATAPFIGLFGTVWGIMNSFQAIALTRQTNLAIIAPGLAEALFATALGLFVAIPAVAAYNNYKNQTTRYGERVEGFMTEFGAILSRQLEERG
jgi:biopolymer transport protein TolQ